MEVPIFRDHFVRSNIKTMATEQRSILCVFFSRALEVAELAAACEQQQQVNTDTYART